MAAGEGCGVSALAISEKRYQGAACLKCHGTVRYVSSGECCECVRLRNAEHRRRCLAPVISLVPSVLALTGRFVAGPWRACPLDMCPFCGSTIKDAFDRGRHIHDCRRRHHPGASS